MSRFSALLIVVFGLVASRAQSQVVPPRGHGMLWELGYEQGFGDASAAATQPAAPSWPADVVFHPDHTYHISPDGRDKLSDGSEARPFATLSRALQQIHQDRAGGKVPKLAGIAYRADGTYKQNQIVSENHLVVTCYGATSAEQRPTIVSTDIPFLWLKASDVHLQNLRIIADPQAGASHGVYVNGGDNFSMDYCEVEGFKLFNVCLIGGATHVRLHHNYIANAFDPAVKTMSCSGLYTECVAPDIQCNILYHNGWRAPFDLNNSPLVQAMMFRHGWYENPGAGATAGTDKFNFYLRNAACGHQCRAGGSAVLWNVFWDNGNACDVFTGAGPANNLGGEIGHCVFFGNLSHDFASWGGGAVGQSLADNLHDLLFASPATSMQLPAAITIGWNTNAGNGSALPDAATAVVRDCRGFWPTGDVTLASGRTATVTNVSIRKSKADEHVPTLMDFFGTKDDASTAELLRTHLHEPKYSAQAVIDWVGRSLPPK